MMHTLILIPIILYIKMKTYIENLRMYNKGSYQVTTDSGYTISVKGSEPLFFLQ